MSQSVRTSYCLLNQLYTDYYILPYAVIIQQKVQTFSGTPISLTSKIDSYSTYYTIFWVLYILVFWIIIKWCIFFHYHKTRSKLTINEYFNITDMIRIQSVKKKYLSSFCELLRNIPIFFFAFCILWHTNII